MSCGVNTLFRLISIARYVLVTSQAFWTCALTLDQWTKIVGNHVCFFLTTFFSLLKVSDSWALPDYLPTVRNIYGNHERIYLIEQYFRLGLDYPEITSFLLLCHGVRLSIRQLK